MADKYVFEAHALMKFFYKRGWTDLSKIKAVLKNYDEEIKDYIMKNLVSWQQKYRYGYEDIFDSFRYEEAKDFFVTYKSNREPKGISRRTKKPFSEISRKKEGTGLTYECIIPHVLSEELRQARLQFCIDLFETANNNEFKLLSKLITGIAIWLPYKCEKILSHKKGEYIYETKSGEMTMFFCFFDPLGIIYHDFMPVNATATVDGMQYVEVLQKFWNHLQKVRVEYKNTEAWFLMLENIMPHNSAMVKEFLAKNQICLIEYPRFSPDLSLCEDLLFNKEYPCLRGIFNPKTKIVVDYEQFRILKVGAAIFRFLQRINECIKLKGKYVTNIKPEMTLW